MTNHPIVRYVLSEKVFIPVLIFGAVFSVYFPVLFHAFGSMDDYLFLMHKRYDRFPFSLLAAGRPLNSLLIYTGFSWAGTVENLAFLRGCTLLGIGIFCYGLYRFSRSHHLGATPSLIMALGVISLPSFQVYAAWAQHFSTPYAGNLALLAAFVLSPACPLRTRSRLFAICASSLAFMLALLIYQPVAMFFLTGIFLSILAGERGGSPWKADRYLDAFLSFIISMSGAWAALKIGAGFFAPAAERPRYHIVSDYWGKIVWFLSEPLAMSSSLYFVPRNNFVIFCVALLALLGLGIIVNRDKFARALFFLLLAIICIFGSYFPNLATSENWATYRSIGALSAGIWIALVFIAMEIGQFINTLGFKYLALRKLSYGLALLILPLVFIQAHQYVLHGFVLHSVQEFGNLYKEIEKNRLNLNHNNTGIIIFPSKWNEAAAHPRAEEFGVPSSFSGNNARAMTHLALIQAGLPWDRTIMIGDKNQQNIPMNMIRLNFTDFLIGP